MKIHYIIGDRVGDKWVRMACLAFFDDTLRKYKQQTTTDKNKFTCKKCIKKLSKIQNIGG